MLALLIQAPLPPPHWYKDAIALSTVFIAIATGVNLVVSFFLWRSTAGATKVTRDMFLASQRPYVGIPTYDTHWDANTKTFKFVGHARNFGSIPAQNVGVLKSEIVVDGVPVDRPTPTKFGKFTIFPETPHYLNFFLTSKAAVMVLPERLEIHITLRYEGLNGKGYRYEQEALYHEQTGQFIALKEISTEE
jgi:hypothetical protein